MSTGSGGAHAEILVIPTLTQQDSMHAVAHEAGHRWAAARRDVQLGPPIFVPAWLGFLGSFGAITFFRRVLPDRCAALLHKHLVRLTGAHTHFIQQSWQSAVAACTMANCTGIGKLVVTCRRETGMKEMSACGLFGSCMAALARDVA